MTDWQYVLSTLLLLFYNLTAQRQWLLSHISVDPKMLSITITFSKTQRGVGPSKVAASEARRSTMSSPYAIL
ncbi:hypothetical protein EV702DRAFT_1135213 [Suillus placidus]|uniref:Secreted protein n=1 Tax=Suillus placidus TaxID=48579 RepID=A0A9P6ZNS3_9AGAM|nr:hypothetical protein EV702DRAFT_1135213 [Suillus placidus]